MSSSRYLSLFSLDSGVNGIGTPVFDSAIAGTGTFTALATGTNLTFGSLVNTVVPNTLTFGSGSTAIVIDPNTPYLRVDANSANFVTSTVAYTVPSSTNLNFQVQSTLNVSWVGTPTYSPGSGSALRFLFNTNIVSIFGTGDITFSSQLDAIGWTQVTGNGTPTIDSTITGTGEHLIGVSWYGQAAYIPSAGSSILLTWQALPTVTGNGSIVFSSTLDSSGWFSVYGTGAVQFDSTIAGTGVRGVTGTGAATLSTTADGAGWFSVYGDGAATLTTSLVSDGWFYAYGDGAATLAAPTMSGAGWFYAYGDGAATLTTTTVGLGFHAISGDGAATLAAPTMSGAGWFYAYGDGAATLAAPTMSGAGWFYAYGDGDASISTSIAGTGIHTGYPKHMMLMGDTHFI